MLERRKAVAMSKYNKVAERISNFIFSPEQSVLFGIEQAYARAKLLEEKMIVGTLKLVVA